MKLLVTGGAGFIGSNFIYHILNAYPSHEIFCIDALTYAGNMETLKGALENPKFSFFKGDITDRDFIFDIFSKVFGKSDKSNSRKGINKFVVNFAAESHVDRSIENSGIFLNTNIVGTQIVMDACREFHVDRFHQVSTDEVYGDLPLDQKDVFFTEQTPIQASSPYAASKAAADLLVQSYYRTYKFPMTISRCSNNYGPYHFPEKLIPLVIANALNSKPIPVYGTGENVRDWLYVRDHCRAIELIMHKGEIGEVYNVGGHNERSNLQVVKTILTELGKPEDLISYISDRKGHDLRYAIDPSKIKNELGWEPTTNFDMGIRQTIKWYIDNKKWWENIISGEYKEYYQKMYDEREKIF